MYLSHFNLKRNPFKTTPEFLWLGEKHKEALETLRYGILSSDGQAVITGDIGTGKTTLANALLNDLADEVVIAKIPYPEGDTLDFFKLISAVYGISTDFNSKESFLVDFESFLRRSFSAGKRVVLIIDEAQRLSHGHLEELLYLTHFEENGKRLLTIVFVGQNEFKTVLSEQSGSSFGDKVAVNYHLTALTQEDTSQYILHRLRVAQCEREIFTPETIQDIFVYSRGIPRLINNVCDLALLMTYLQSRERVLPETVKQCAERLLLPNEKPDSNRPGMDRASGMEEAGNWIGEAINDEARTERVIRRVAKPAWVRGTYAFVFAYLVLLSGLLFFLYRQGEVKRHSGSGKETIQKSSISQTGTGRLDARGPSGPGSLTTKGLPPAKGSFQGSQPSAQQDRSGRLDETGKSKDTGARPERPEGRKTVGSKASPGPASRALTDSSLEKRSPNEKAKGQDNRGGFSLEDSRGGSSGTPRSTTGRSEQETSGKDEEVEPGRVIDWLLEKRGDKK